MRKAEAATKVLPPIIQDEMQKRRMMKRATTAVPKFQTRVFVLYKHQLVYKTKDGKQTRGSVSVMGIKICEDVEECSFNRPHVFQVGYLEKGKMFHLYIQAKDHAMRETWKFHIRKLCSTYNDHRMQQRYHPGHYKKDKWSCCASEDKNNIGCRQAYMYDGPQALGEGSTSSPTTLTLPLSGPLLHKTPVLHRADPIHRVKMPSECYDSDDMDDILTSPSPSPLQKEKALIVAPEKKSKAPLSSQSMRYTSRYAVGAPGGSVSGVSDTEGGMSMSTPYYCPINTGAMSCNTRPYSMTSSTMADAGSERLDSFSALSLNHISRLDSQGSTICSSICDSIPRTESDYQKKIEEEGESTGPVYTNSSITRSRSTAEMEGDLMHLTLMNKDSIAATYDFQMDLNEERTQSGTYVNTHGGYT